MVKTPACSVVSGPFGRGALDAEVVSSPPAHAAPVGHLDAEPYEPARPGERAQDHRREHPEVDVAARQHDTHAAAGETRRVFEDGCESRGARAFHDDLLDLERDRE